MPTCLIVGAGLTGLTAAGRLQELGYEVTLVDKARRAGGRLATRRIGTRLLDSGAQFFTHRSKEFSSAVDEWKRRGLVHEWTRGFLNTELHSAEDGHPRYAASGGMNSIAQHLATGFNVECECPVRAIRLEGKHWRVESETRTWIAESVILTPPVPQSLALLTAVDLQGLGELQTLEYDRCLSLLSAVRGLQLPAPGAMQLTEGEPLRWIADNSAKGLSAEPGLTLHASPAYSSWNWEASSEEITAELVAAARRLIGPFHVEDSYLHRWKFSRPIRQHPQRALLGHTEPQLVFAGDTFGEPRVEGAYLSGQAAAALVAASRP
jgi:predicted NAD/FAD-dependent oxidoreductase